MSQAEPKDLFAAWNESKGPSEALGSLYSDGLQQYWDWLGDNFYPFFGVESFGLAAVDPIDPESSPNEIYYYEASVDLAAKLNFLNTNVFDIIRTPDGRSLANNDWPGNYFGGNNEDEPVDYDYNFYRNVLAPVMVQIAEDIKVIQENAVIVDPNGFNNAFGAGPYKFGQSPPENISELVDNVLDALTEFFELLPDVNISFKKDVEPLPESQGRGPSPISSDINLEKSLGLTSAGPSHYVGLLINPEKSNGARSEPYLPVRLQPNSEGEESLAMGWADQKYQLVDNDGDSVKKENDYSDGVEIPLGLEVTITEIVPSETGIWVGFVSTDAKLSEDLVPTNALPQFGPRWDLITNNQRRVLYTKAHYLRIKESAISSKPDPYVSEKTILGSKSSAVSDRALKAINIKGTEIIDPKQNQNWVQLTPEEVSLNYYSFYEHNIKKLGDPSSVYYNTDTIEKQQTLRYSEGYFYFIAGEQPRKTEADIINESETDIEESPDDLNQAKTQAGSASIEAIKRQAWQNLLNYLGKNTVGGNSNLYDEIYEKYFILVDKKLNAKSTNPNNQKALFAIRSSYIDSLPDVKRPYINDFAPGSPFLSGKNYAVSMPMKEVKKRCDYLVSVLENIKNHVESSKSTIENSNGLEYKLKLQIEAVEDLPSILDNFLSRQGFPSSSNRGFIYDMVREGVETTDDHIIQIGIKDNNLLAGSVRETISYVLFSPDPTVLSNTKLNEMSVGTSNLLYFDPYAKNPELAKQRSAIPLRVGLPVLRREFEGVYGSRALHLFLSYDKIKNKLIPGQTDIQNKWMDFMSSFMVPPVRIYLSKDPSLVEPEEVDCDDLIKRLNRSGPNVGIEEKLLQEQLYNNPKCMERYYQQFSKDTSATSPNLNKKQLEKKQTLGSPKTNIRENEYVKLLYTGFFNVLDAEALIAMILACLEKKIGLAITAEAICERAIIKLIESSGTTAVEQAMLANALLSPDSESSKNFLTQYGDNPLTLTTLSGEPAKYVDGELVPLSPEEKDALPERKIDHSFNDAPIAASMMMSTSEPPAVVEVIKNLEKTGTYIQFLPGKRPISGEEIPLPFGSAAFKLLDGNTVTVPENYTQKEIEKEKDRLIGLGYTSEEAQSKLVESGYLVPDPKQYEPLLGTQNYGSPIAGMSEKLRSGQFSGAVNYAAAEELRAIGQDAENWLNYMKNTVGGITNLCELVVGDILDGLKDMIRDPGAFLDGGGEGWWEDFKEKLKRQFSFPTPTLKFPDNLMTDNHMGDYEKQLLKTLLSMVVMILAQIINLLIKQTLEQCLEEDSDIGPGGVPSNNAPSIPLPALQAADLPTFNNLSNGDVVAWLKDLIDSLSIAQLCSLLRGDATKNTLNQCLERTRIKWPGVYSQLPESTGFDSVVTTSSLIKSNPNIVNLGPAVPIEDDLYYIDDARRDGASGIDTIYEIRSIFEDLGEKLNLDICTISESPVALSLVDDLCQATFDYDARCAQLKKAGLSQSECQEQIDSELEDLKNKALGLIDLSLFENNPLAGSFPSICGEDGNFSIPEGVEDTMERITNNMLTNIKGSLLIDMNGLKFFSTPPRALLAISDPEELQQAHQMFVDAIRDPYKIECMALVMDPFEYQDKYVTAGPRYNEIIPDIYPITYNKYFHHGSLSTFRATGLEMEGSDDWVQPYTILPRDSPEIAGAAFYDDPDADADDVDSSEIYFITDELLESELLDEDKYLEDINDAYSYALSDTWSEQKKFRPLNNSLLLPPPDVFQGLPGWQQHATNESNGFDNLLPNNNVESVKSILEPIVAGSNNTKEVYNKVSALFDDESNPLNVDKLLISPKQVFKPEGDSGGLFSYAKKHNNYDSTANNSIPPGDVFSNVKYNFPGHLNINNQLYPAARKVHTLSTRLHEIDSNPNRWYAMLRYYTGVKIVNDDHGYRNFHQKMGNTTFTSKDVTSAMASAIDVEDATSVDNVPAALFSAYAFQSVSYYKYEFYNLLNRLRVSSGLRRLILLAAEKIEESDDLFDGKYYKPDLFNEVDHEIAFAFMNLTLGEALGITDERIKKLYPDFDPVVGTIKGVILGIDKSIDATVVQTKGETNPESGHIRVDVSGGSNNPTYFAHSIVYERIFRDPDSPLNQGTDEVISHFSMNNDFVNKELYDFFNVFPKCMGGEIDAITQAQEDQLSSDMFNVFGHDSTTDSLVGYQAFYRLENNSNFNPNIIKHELPFSEVRTKPIAGFDANSSTQDILQTFMSTDGGDQLAAIAEQLENINFKRNLINQNTLTPVQDNFYKQTEKIKNISKLIKASVQLMPNDGASPPNPIADDSRLSKEIYNFNFSSNLDSDVVDLLENVLGASNPINTFKSFSENYISDEELSFSHPVANGDGNMPTSNLLGSSNFVEIFGHNSLSLEPTNSKAQIFGEFMTQKFMEKFDKYYDASNALDSTKVEEEREDFIKYLRFVLSTYSFSSLQYAYSTQMFTKLKHSRLHKRGAMKKLWKKILKSPLNSNDPRCQQVFDQIGVPLNDELKETETDFFQIDDVKSRIIDFYKKSLCKDLYEESFEDTHATQTSLLEGMIILLVKVYVLEMCLSAVIAWDSFDMAEIFEEQAMTSVVIDNISKDWDVNFITSLCNDILQKEKGLSLEELMAIRKEKSSLEYMISAEAENISQIINNIFSNSQPLSTDLDLVNITNSDVDYYSEYITSINSDAESHSPEKYAALALKKRFIFEDIAVEKAYGHEFVSDCRFKNNIYSMNYGHPEKHEAGTFSSTGPDIKSDIFGLFTDKNNPTIEVSEVGKKRGNKNYLHSLPMSYYPYPGKYSGWEAIAPNDEMILVQNWSERTGINTNCDYAEIYNTRRSQEKELGYSDALSRENFHESTFGNMANAKLGNVIFQPYVKIVDYEPGEARNFVATVYDEYEASGEPCDGAAVFAQIDANKYSEIIDELLAPYRKENNNTTFCYVYDYVPLSAWSDFYNTVFLEKIVEYTDDEVYSGFRPLLALFERHGLDPFFKKISFGMRMTYSTSYPFSPYAEDEATAASGLSFHGYMNAAFNVDAPLSQDGTELYEDEEAISNKATGIRKIKSLYGQRPYLKLEPDPGQSSPAALPKILREIQIPVFETEKDLIFSHGSTSQGNSDPNNIKYPEFTVAGGKKYSLKELGSYIPFNELETFSSAAPIDVLMQEENVNKLDSLLNNHSQFFYKNLSQSMMKEVKDSSEFKLMYDYFFPVRRYMSLATILASDGLSKFIPEPTIVLDKTKKSLKDIIEALVNSSDYKFMPDPIASLLENFTLGQEQGTTAKEPNLTKEILKIIYRTPLLILKGFVEVTDPAVIIAKTIIDVANAVAFSTLNAIKQGFTVAKKVLQSGIDAANQIMIQLEVQAGISVGMVNSLKPGLGPIGDAIVVDNSGPLESWLLIVRDENTPDTVNGKSTGGPFELQKELGALDPDGLEAWTSFKDSFEDLQNLQTEYAAAQSQLDDLTVEKNKLESEYEVKLAEAEKELKAVFQSPFLLPGTWAALLPSMTPYGGGLIPPPFFVGPPSTFPGMIYLALLLIDAIEEKIHDDLTGLDDLNCEDEL